MDWKELTRHVNKTDTLSVHDLAPALEILKRDQPDLGTELTNYYTRNGKLSGFMQTSVAGEVLERRKLNAGTTLGVWNVVELVGSGGMGDVYKAERSDGLYEQIVALKVIHSQDAESQQRFEQERKRLASLEHSGISRIIDGGTTDDGSPHMVMEYVQGQPIDRYIDTNKLLRKDILRLFTELCEAVSHAHGKLILHRDIKTSNVLVDNSGAVRLIDFGIASAVGEKDDRNDGPMTISYASPEQLMRKSPAVGSDIFALGVLLHHLLTKQPPERNSDGSVSVDANTIADADLTAIITKATAYEVEDRYPSVTSFADDVNAYLDLRPVVARAGGTTYKARKYLRRNALASVLASAFVLALISGLVTSLVMANRATHEAARANAEVVEKQWNLDWASVNNNIANGRADAFMYVYGQEDSQDLLSERLLDYLGTVKEIEKKNYPNILAAKQYAVGKHFLDRNDYRTARAVLEPWLDEGYGEPLLVSWGQAALGFTYSKMGESDLAKSMFKQVDQFYKATPMENTIDHAVAPIQVALLSDEPADTLRARSIIEEVLAYDDVPYNRWYLIGQIYKIELSKMNWDAALSALQRQVGLMEDGSQGRIAGTDTAYIYLSQMLIFHTGELQQAAIQLEKAEQISDQQKGESLMLGLIYEQRAIIEWQNGNLTTALEQLDQALLIIQKYSGQANDYARALAQKGIVLVQSGDNNGAMTVATELQQLPVEAAGVWPDLLRLHIVAVSEGIAPAQNLYDEIKGSGKNLQQSLVANFYLKKLEEQGLQL